MNIKTQGEELATTVTSPETAMHHQDNSASGTTPDNTEDIYKYACS